jgi:hypothetical protein
MLLVALHEKNNFALPTERVPEWYGWSADTAERGLTNLERAGVLTHITRLKKAPLSPTGQTRINKYLLHKPFGDVAPDEIFDDSDMFDALFFPASPKGSPARAVAGATVENAQS